MPQAGWEYSKRVDKFHGGSDIPCWFYSEAAKPAESSIGSIRTLKCHFVLTS